MNTAGYILIDPAPDTQRTAVNSTIKTILLHIQNDTSLDARIDAALSLARATSSHLRCLHVTPIEAYVTMDSLGGVFVMDALMTRIDDEEAELRSRIERQLSAEDVAWDYEHVTASTVGEVVRRAALSDIVISGREAHIGRAQSLEMSILGDVLTSIRTPLLIPGDADRRFDPFGTAVIAWNGNYEAANAVRGALGLLRMASYVHVLQITEEEKSEAFPPTGLLEFLSRHGIHAELSVIEAPVDFRDPKVVSETIVARAEALKGSYVVMGGYSHSRAGEFLFGGVTRRLLKNCPVTLVVAH